MLPKTEFDYIKYVKLVSKRRYLFVTIALLIMTLVAIASYMLPEKYEARSTVFIEKSVIGDLVKGIAVSPSIDDKVKVLAYAMKSRTLLLKVLNGLEMNLGKLTDAQQEKMVKDFQDRTDIKLKDREGLFIISFYHENPQLARDYVNGLVRRYIEENVSAKREDSYGATRFLTEQIATVKEKLEKTEASVNSFRQANGSVLAVNENLLLTEISEARQKLDDISIRRNQLESLRAMAQKSDPLQARLAGMKKRLNELNLVYTDNYPEVMELKSSIESVKAQIKSQKGEPADENGQSPVELQKIAFELNSIQAQERSQKRIIASKQALLRSVPAARAAAEELEREKISQKNLYEQLVARLGQSEVSKQMEVQDKAATFRIVDPAVMPSKPVSPDRIKIMLFGILAGLAGSFALLVLLDHFDMSVRSLDELKSLGVPILAVVPRIQNPDEQQLTRRRDIRFFALSGAYFTILLAVLTFEVLRSHSVDVKNQARAIQHLTLLDNK
jgi:polysaccharide chain length determinant protein (PEP-CTERM system associated)